MGFALSFTNTIHTITCYKCGVTFGIEESHYKRLLNNHAEFFCINGHPQHFTGKTEADKARDELAREKQRREMAEREAAAEARRAKRAENALKRERHRVGNGVCPCCNRSFQNLQRHMATKHPEHAA